MKYKLFKKECVTNDAIKLGVWANLIIVGHSNGGGRALYFLKGHSANQVQEIVNGGVDFIQFFNPSTYELGIKYTGNDPDTIRVTAMYLA